MPSVVVLELAQHAQEMALVPDPGAVEQFVAQLLHPHRSMNEFMRG